MIDDAFRGTDAVANGLVTRGALRGRRFRRLLPNVYAPAELTVDLALRSRAAYAWARGRGVMTGWSAAELLAAWCAPRDAPAELTLLGRHPPAPPGVLLRQDRLTDDEWTTVGDIAVTTPRRTAYDLARRHDLTGAVAAVDALAGRFGFAAADVLEVARRHPGARNARRLPDVVALADPRAESVMETRLRLLLVLGGLPAPAVQYAVVDDRAHVVATVDLAYPEALVAIEYEGAAHFTDRRVLRDGRRYTRLADLGWRVYRYFARDVHRRPDEVVEEIRRALTTQVLPPRRQVRAIS